MSSKVSHETDEATGKNEILNEVIKYVRAASVDTEYHYPKQASKDLKRSIRKIAENIKVVNGDLMYVKKKGPEIRILLKNKNLSKIKVP